MRVLKKIFAVLLISAGADRVWPSSAMAAAMASRLKARGHPYPDEHFDHPLAGHGYHPPTDAAGPAINDPSDSAAGGGPFLAEVCRFLRRLR